METSYLQTLELDKIVDRAAEGCVCKDCLLYTSHPAQMPTALEAGTLNVPGLAGLCAGVEWILAQGVDCLLYTSRCV